MIKIRHKIGAAIALLSLTTASIVGFISIVSTKNIVTSEAESKLTYTVRAYGIDFEHDLNKITHLSSSLEALLKGTWPLGKVMSSHKEMETYKEKILPIVKQYLTVLKPSTCWIIFNPDLAPGKNTLSFEDIDNDGHYKREQEYSVNDFDLADSTMEWWTGAIKMGEIWTKPYFWGNWNVELISYSRAVFIDGQHIACVGSDFAFQNLRKKLASVDVYNSGYMTLLDEQQNFIIHPYFANKRLSDVLDSTTYKKIVGLFETKKQGKFYYKLGTEDKILAFYKLSNGWFLAVVVPVRDIFDSSDKIVNNIAIIILLGIILSILTAFILSASLTRPIYQLVDQFRQGADGNLTVRANVKATVEISELASHFNRFMETMQKMIEQLRQSESKLLEAKRKAEESDKLKSAFLANISHEVRTPLNAIIGFSQILASEDLEEGLKQKYMNYIHSSSERLTSIVEDVMIFSQLEQGLIVPAKKQFKLKEQLESLYSEFSQKYASLNTSINFTLLMAEHWTDKEIFTDIVQFRRIFSILLHNSWKFTNQGRISFGYTMGENNSLIFFVRDTGVGIPETEKEKIFLKFYKYQPFNDKYLDGTGLGLAIARDLVALLDGEIWVESKINHGTTVSFVIET
jgi:signal transduction histidine kinase